VYNEQGTYNVKVLILENEAVASGVTDSQQVNEPAINGSSATLTTINEGDPSASGVTVATFTHANGVEPASAFNATVNWGISGHTADTGTVSQNGDGSYTVKAARPVFSEEGTYTVTVSISEDNASTSVTDNQQVNEPPIVGSTASLSAVNEGDASATVTVSTFTHANGIESASDFTATVIDTDGSGHNHTWTGVSISGPVGGVYTITAKRPVYSEEGNYTVTVTLSEAGEPATAITVTDAQQVNEPAINGSSAMLPTANEGDAPAVVTVATFTHANGVEPATDFTATVNWGISGHTADVGTVTQNGDGSYTVKATRPFLAPGQYTVTVTISEDNATTSVTDMQQVNNVPPTVSQPNVTPSTTAQGMSTTFNISGTFTDPGTTNESYNGVVDWGDNTPTSSFAISGYGSYSFTGSHTYATATTYNITVSITDGPVNGPNTSTGTSPPATETVTSGNGGPPPQIGGDIYALDGSANGSLTLTGNAILKTTGKVVVDSTSSTAITATGNASLTAAAVDDVGGYSRTGNATFSPPPSAWTHVFIPDPLASVPPPTAATAGPLMPMGSVNLSGKSTMTINPGIYTQISVSGNAVLTLNPGVYVIEGGGLSVTGNASLQTGTVPNTYTGTGVMIFNAGSAYSFTLATDGGNFGGIAISGNGQYNLTAPTTGAYQGLLIYQARDNTRALSLTGNAVIEMSGTVYAKAAQLATTGNGNTNKLTVGIVVDKITVTGNASLTQLAQGSDGVVDGAGMADTLLAGNLDIYIDNSTGFFTDDMLARIQESITSIDNLLVPYSVTITLESDPSLANVILDAGTTSASGGMADGVLGCFNPTGSQIEITMIQGWDWYAGADPSQIGAAQYDFETTIAHELGHSLGLGGSSSETSPMNEVLPTGVARRTMTVADLNVTEAFDGADPETAGGFHLGMIPASAPAALPNGPSGVEMPANISGLLPGSLPLGGGPLTISVGKTDSTASIRPVPNAVPSGLPAAASSGGQLDLGPVSSPPTAAPRVILITPALPDDHNGGDELDGEARSQDLGIGSGTIGAWSGDHATAGGDHARTGQPAVRLGVDGVFGKWTGDDRSGEEWLPGVDAPLAAEDVVRNHVNDDLAGTFAAGAAMLFAMLGSVLDEPMDMAELLPDRRNKGTVRKR
jgi:hypothetical protein